MRLTLHSLKYETGLLSSQWIVRVLLIQKLLFPSNCLILPSVGSQGYFSKGVSSIFCFGHLLQGYRFCWGVAGSDRIHVLFMVTSFKVCNANISADVRAPGPLKLRISSPLTCFIPLIQADNEEGPSPSVSSGCLIFRELKAESLNCRSNFRWQVAGLTPLPFIWSLF